MCGADVLTGDRFCISCGMPVAASETGVPVGVTSDDSLLQSHQLSSDLASPTAPGESGPAAGGRSPMLAAGAVLVVGLIVGAATTMILMRDSAAPSAESPSQPVTEPQADSANAGNQPQRAAGPDRELETTPDPPNSHQGQRDVEQLPTGLFCRDLHERGYSYAEAVTYWEREGRTPRMDASGNGIPCQTVYPADEIDAYWGISDAETLPSGLFCRDLYQWGYSYGAAVTYWEREGRTPRMDASGNGIPCQTVYPADEIDAYWNR